MFQIGPIMPASPLRTSPSYVGAGAYLAQVIAWGYQASEVETATASVEG